MFVGRKNEKELLQSLLTEDESQFVAVVGRRRIGKTFLIRESFDYNFTFEHTGVSNNNVPARDRKQLQLDKFKESLQKSGLEIKEKISSWNEAFNYLKKLIDQSQDEKKIIFIDELSWMDTKESGLISALESFWNGFVQARRQKDVILVVCASATYWMINNIVNSKGGLHNRLTLQIHLKPFTLKECSEYIESKGIQFTKNQILDCYMILGGVPFYWSLLNKNLSFSQNIDKLFFDDSALLKKEYDNLYSALFNNPDKYIMIIEALTKSSKGLTRDEICASLKISQSGDLTKKLTELENCDFIRKYIPFGYKDKNFVYQLIDNYTLFYYKFIKDQNLDSNYWLNSINSPTVNTWSGFAFERVCLQHINEIKKALGIMGVITTVNTWRTAKDLEKGIYGSQIDLLIVRKDQVINLCEIKYSNDDYLIDSNFDKAMKRKISDLINVTKTKYAIYPTLITNYGVVKNAYASTLNVIITMDDLFQ